MTKPKGYYTDDEKTVHPVMGQKHPHVKPLKKGTSRLSIPKRQLKKKRVKGFSKLTRVQSYAQANYAHAIVHSPRYQKNVIEKMGREKGEQHLRKEHDFLVKHYIRNHDSPFKVEPEALKATSNLKVPKRTQKAIRSKA